MKLEITKEIITPVQIDQWRSSCGNILNDWECLLEENEGTYKGITSQILAGAQKFLHQNSKEEVDQQATETLLRTEWQLLRKHANTDVEDIPSYIYRVGNVADAVALVLYEGTDDTTITREFFETPTDANFALYLLAEERYAVNDSELRKGLLAVGSALLYAASKRQGNPEEHATQYAQALEASREKPENIAAALAYIERLNTTYENTAIPSEVRKKLADIVASNQQYIQTRTAV